MDTMNLSDFSGFGLESVKEDTVANLTAIDEDSDEAPSSSMDLLRKCNLVMRTYMMRKLYNLSIKG